MRGGSLRAFVAVAPLIGALSGCATTRELDVWLSQSEPRTWAAHSVEVAAATVASDVIGDNPWWGYAFVMGAQVGWEVQEARLTDWDVPWWGTAMDLLAPAVTGFVTGKWLSGRKSKNDPAKPMFADGQPTPENGGDAETDAGDRPSEAGSRAAAGSASRLFVVRPSLLWSHTCGPTLRGQPRLAGRRHPGPRISHALRDPVGADPAVIRAPRAGVGHGFQWAGAWPCSRAGAVAKLLDGRK